MTDYTPEALEALAATCRMKHRAEAANTPYGVMPSGEFAKIATALTTIADRLRTGQLVPAQPSGDVVEAVALKAVFPILWRQEFFNGITPQDDVDQYRLDGARSMGGRVEGYEVQAREIATAAITTYEAVSGVAKMREALQLPRLDDGLIEAAMHGHYGKRAEGIDGGDLTANGYNWTFRQGFKRMWAGVRKELKRRAALGEKP